MDAEQFRESAKCVIDAIADYFINVNNYPATPNVAPGFLAPNLPTEAPKEGESFETVMADVQRLIIPALTHWNHPYFLAYFPGANSFASNLGDLLANALGVQGSNWLTCPAATELETVMLDWMAVALGLPDKFMSTSERGGGCIMSNCSEGTCISLMVARSRKISKFCETSPNYSIYDVESKLVAYRSMQAHSSVEKAGLISAIRMRPVPTNEKRQMNTEALKNLIISDIKNGNIPFYICAAVGTTNSCALDDVNAITKIAKKYKLWVHVDAAYAGLACVCPEYRYIFNGIKNAMSVSVNPQKWGLVNIDCSLFFCKHMDSVESFLSVRSDYPMGPLPKDMPVFGNRHLGSSCRMRSLKIWFVMRLYGVEGMRSYIRRHCALAKLLEQLLLSDDTFEIVEEVTLGLVCFRKMVSECRGTARTETAADDDIGHYIRQSSNEVNVAYLEEILEDRRLFLVPGMFYDTDVFFLRISMNSEYQTEAHIHEVFQILKSISQKQDEKLKEKKLSNGELEKEEEVEVACSSLYSSMSFTATDCGEINDTKLEETPV